MSFFAVVTEAWRACSSPIIHGAGSARRRPALWRVALPQSWPPGTVLYTVKGYFQYLTLEVLVHPVLQVGTVLHGRGGGGRQGRSDGGARALSPGAFRSWARGCVNRKGAHQGSGHRVDDRGRWGESSVGRARGDRQHRGGGVSPRSGRC